MVNLLIPPGREREPPIVRDDARCRPENNARPSPDSRKDAGPAFRGTGRQTDRQIICKPAMQGKYKAAVKSHLLPLRFN